MRSFLVNLLLSVSLVGCMDGSSGGSNAYLVGAETKQVQEIAFDAEAKYLELLAMIKKEIADRIAGDNDLWKEINRLDARIDNLEIKVNKNTYDIKSLNEKLDKYILEFEAKHKQILSKFSQYTTLSEFNEFKVDQASKFLELKESLEYSISLMSIDIKKWVNFNFTSQAEYNEFKAGYSSFYSTVMNELQILKNLSKTYVTISEFSSFQQLINGKVENLDEFIKSLESQVFTNKSDIVNLTNYYQDIKNQVHTNTENIRLLNVNLSEYKNEVTTYVTNINKKITELKNQVGDVNVSELYKDVEQIKAKQVILCQSLIDINAQINFLVSEIKRVEAGMATNSDLENLKNQLTSQLIELVDSKTKIYDEWVLKFDQIISSVGSVEEVIARLELVKLNEIRIQELETNLSDYKIYVTNNYATNIDVQNIEVQINYLQEALSGKVNTCTQNLVSLIGESVDSYRVQDVVRLYSELVSSQQYSSINEGERKLLFYNSIQSFLVYHKVDLTGAEIKDKVDTLVGLLNADYEGVSQSLVNYQKESLKLSYDLINALSATQRETLYNSFRNHVTSYETDSGDKCSDGDLNLEQTVPGFDGHKGSVHEYYAIKWINSFISLPRIADSSLSKLMLSDNAYTDNVELMKLLGILNSSVFKISYGDSIACQEAIASWQVEAFGDGDKSIIDALKLNLLTEPRLVEFKGSLNVISSRLTSLKDKVEATFGHELGTDDEFVSEFSSVLNALIVEGQHHQKYLELKSEIDSVFTEIDSLSAQQVAEFKSTCIDGFDKNSLEGIVATNGTALKNLISVIMGSPLFDELCPDAKDLLAQSGALVGALPLYCGGDASSGCEIIETPPELCYAENQKAEITSIRHGYHETIGEGTNLCNGTNGSLLLNNQPSSFSLNDKCVAIYRSQTPRFIDNYIKDFYLYTNTKNATGFKVTATAGSTTVGEVNVDLTSQSVVYSAGDISQDSPISVIVQSQYEDSKLENSITHTRMSQLIKDLYDSKNQYLTNFCLNVTPYNNNCEGDQFSSGDTTQYCARAMSPIILDFGHIGQKSVPVQGGVKFDLDADGIKELSGWVAPNATKIGFLAIDLNKNGQIDDGSELFGQGTKLLKSNSKALNGYIALADYDSNNDKVISSLDKKYSELKVWFDFNSNAIVDSGEMKSLDEVKVSSISIDYKKSSYVDGYSGNKFLYESTFVQNGSEKKSYDVFFSTSQKNLVLND